MALPGFRSTILDVFGSRGPKSGLINQSDEGKYKTLLSVTLHDSLKTPPKQEDIGRCACCRGPLIIKDVIHNGHETVCSPYCSMIMFRKYDRIKEAY